jgi:transposase
MSREGRSMRKIKEILRLRIGLGLSTRQVAKSCKISVSTVNEYEKKFREAGLAWPLPEEMDDAALTRLLRARPSSYKHSRVFPDTAYLITEMRKPHVTLHLLWLEYRDVFPDGYGYTQFCHFYNEAVTRLDLTLRQHHRAGEKVFTDYAGDTLSIVAPTTGTKRPVYLFVACLGASNYTYAEGTLSMNLPSWIDSHVRAFEFFGGVPEIIVPDNTRCAVIKPDRYEPDLNPEFAEMAAHYGCGVIPARVRRPRDKAKVENAVLVAERWILAALRNRTFFSLTELNEAIAELLDKLNTRKFKAIDSTRCELFEKLDAPALRPLPTSRYQFAEWRTAKVNIDYHISVDKHFYSVPYQLVGKQLDIRLSATTIEVLHQNRRVATHIRSYIQGAFTTDPAHRPKSHQKYLEWTPSRIISWAASKGPGIAALVTKILETKPHPEMGYRACLGIIRLADKFSSERVEAAATRALRANAISYTSVKSILEKGLDRLPLKQTPEYVPVKHSNIRGKDYYSRRTQ